MSIGQHALSPPEAYLLLTPEAGEAREAAKLGALFLMAQRAIEVRKTESKGLFGMTSERTEIVAGPWNGDGGGPVGSIWTLVRGLPAGSGMEQMAKAMESAWGGGMKRYATDIVLPALERRGLVRKDNKKFLGLFTMKRWARTPEGDAAAREIEAAMDQARRIPDFLDSDPRQAAVLIAAVGAAVLLVPQLREHFAEMARVMQTQRHDNSDTSSESSWSSDSSGSSTSHPPPDDPGRFDFGAMDVDTAASLSSDMDSFDSSFDASDSGGSDSSSDSGGDSGGGDGGGGGD